MQAELGKMNEFLRGPNYATRRESFFEGAPTDDNRPSTEESFDSNS